VPKGETLQSLLVEVEFLVNSSPYVSSDPDDPESITPNHIFLGPRSVESTPPGRFHVDDNGGLCSIGQTSFGEYISYANINPHYMYVESG
jgi:hypothetical protein